jgi:lactate dehydrogenase-like 2-hydroxyacid dehydrogenase
LSEASRPALLVTRKLPSAVEQRLEADYDAALNADDHPRGVDEIIAASQGKHAILCTVGDPFSARLINRLPQSIRILATFSAGYNHIDVGAAQARGMAVTNTPDVLTDATADIAMLLMLGAARRASEGERLVRRMAWTGWSPTHLMGTHLGGKRLAIVGLGRIGEAVGRRAQAFGMEVHYANRSGRRSQVLPHAVLHSDIDSLLPVADVLSLHAPSTPDTRRWLSRERIARLPVGAIVVNTARGDLVDDEALIEALRSGHVAAAGLDVFDAEPAVNPGYLALENTFLLPHLGSATRETRIAMGMRAADNLDAFFSGLMPGDLLPASCV